MSSPDSVRRDVITGGRKRFNSQLRQLRNYLVEAEWVATERYVTFFGDDMIIGSDSDQAGTLDFAPLSNGVLKATLAIKHVTDDFPIVTEHVIALNPGQKTFLGTRIDTVGLTATGSVDRGNQTLYWTDIGTHLGIGSQLGNSHIRSMNFVNIV